MTGTANMVAIVRVKLTNVGVLVWQPGAVNLAYHLHAASGNVYVWDGMRTALSAPVAAGDSVVVQAAVRVPATAGAFTIRWDLVQEGITWFSGQGSSPGATPLIVP